MDSAAILKSNPALRARIQGAWQNLGLGTQFLLVSSLTLISGMLIVGSWLSNQIKVATTHASGSTAALFTDSLIEPHVQELRAGSEISDPHIKALDALLQRAEGRKSFIGMKIWKGEKIAYSNHSNQISMSYPGKAEVARAEAGEIIAQFDHLSEADEEFEIKLGTPILEMYAPVREAGTQRVIAVAETYEIAGELAADIRSAKRAAWLIISGMTAAMLALQSLVVGRGSRMIADQRTALNLRIVELTRMSDENKVLHQRTKEAHTRLAELNERILRRIGADLHDGPVQLLGAATIRASAIHDTISKANPELASAVSMDVELLHDAIGDSLEEIRHISSGLAPPEIEKLRPADLVEMAIRRHERRTSTAVLRHVERLPEELTLLKKVGLYRFIQEGLNNAVRHAGGMGQSVSACVDGTYIEVAVADAGPGIQATRSQAAHRSGHGLEGLADRMVSLDSELLITSSPQGGTRLTGRFKI